MTINIIALIIALLALGLLFIGVPAVSSTHEEIRSLASIPMYQRVVIVPAELVDGYTVRASDYERLAAAARALRATCKNVLPPGSYALLDEQCAAIDAVFSPRASN